MLGDRYVGMYRYAGTTMQSNMQLERDRNSMITTGSGNRYNKFDLILKVFSINVHISPLFTPLGRCSLPLTKQAGTSTSLSPMEKKDLSQYTAIHRLL